MLDLIAGDFYVLSVLLEQIQHTLKMTDENSNKAKKAKEIYLIFCRKVDELHREFPGSTKFLEDLDLNDIDEIERISKGDVDHGVIIEYCDVLCAVCGSIGCDMTAKSCKRLIEALRDGSLKADEILENFEEIRGRVKDELSNIQMLILNPSERKLYCPAEPFFGEEFEEKFQNDGVFELSEATKCLALGRPTAAAFHLMRILELGIRSLVRCLQIPDPIKPAERSWGRMLERIWKGIESRWPTVADRSADDGALFTELYASLDAVKNTWRNSTMHVDKKYTEDEAQHILAAVRGFMQRLASRMDENGRPTV